MILAFVLPDRMNFKDELLVLGVQRDNSEFTHSGYKMALSVFKATIHSFEQSGVPRREGFDLFNPNQLICLAMGSMNHVRLGRSVSARLLSISVQRCPSSSG